jgi:hypothetical protein
VNREQLDHFESQIDFLEKRCIDLAKQRDDMLAALRIADAYLSLNEVPPTSRIREQIRGVIAEAEKGA